jgi:hypothetical protein
MTPEHGYYAGNHDGGAVGTSDLGLTADEVFAVLDDLPWDAAMESLREGGPSDA